MPKMRNIDSNEDDDDGKVRKRTRKNTARNVNFSKGEEDWLIQCVLKNKAVLLDKTSNAHSIQQKQAAWIKVETEFNSSSEAKVSCLRSPFHCEFHVLLICLFMKILFVAGSPIGQKFDCEIQTIENEFA